MNIDTSNAPKLVVTRIDSRYKANLVNLGQYKPARWSLYKDDQEVASSNGGTITWHPIVQMSSGIYSIHCNLMSTGGAEIVLKSRQFSYDRNLQGIPPRRLPAARANEYHPSFKQLIYFEGRKAFRKPEYTAWLLDNKTNAYKFADLLAIKTPLLESDPVPAYKMKMESDTVIKPHTGVMSKGVFLLTKDRIIDLYEDTDLPNYDILLERMKALLKTDVIKEDLWIRERLIYGDVSPKEPARDLKFYTFYGQIELALETTRNKGVSRCWYDLSRNRIDTGKYTNNLFEGNGIPEDYYELAKIISKKIPAPFARIDLLASESGAVLNEITPKPGGSNQFAPVIDRRLGQALISADTRLRRDLIDGKSFDEFNEIRHTLTIED